ncbi:GntR family transcriptional regulator [Diaminobutyricibacter sp. McL0618]|uniref:GntR family transcriptional regulator n=1 Tax=Leifsonia sp. McL0618 TaxID=3415677 RepID=UPI003CF73F31
MRRRQLSDEVAAYLRQSIMAGQFAPGDSVKAEAVGDALDVSATPVREALHALRVEGFLELVPRRGFTVAPLVADDIRDIFEAHALIAGELVARATVRANEEQVRGLENIHSQLLVAAAGGQNEMLENLNHEFHRDLYLLAGSERLRWALGNFVKYVPSAFYSEIDGWPEITVADHTRIMEALRRRDAEAGRAAMAEHIRNSGETLAEYFERRQVRA